MQNLIVKAPCINLSELNAIYIEMTAQNCNLRCKHCYINFEDKKVKDFIPIEKVKQNLQLADKSKLQYICLTGAEPMLHPDFNHILRLCLKYSSVIIHTNAFSINDKKARFLRKVEDENNLNHEIIFMISIDHYIEKENDIYRGRGSYRKAVHAIQSLVKYEFNPILSIVNHKNIEEEELKGNFTELCKSLDFQISDINLKIRPLIEKGKRKEIAGDTDFSKCKTECSNSRTLSANGIFVCPLLANDNRGKCGENLKDYSKKCYVETDYCTQCINESKYLFSLDI